MTDETKVVQCPGCLFEWWPSCEASGEECPNCSVENDRVADCPDCGLMTAEGLDGDFACAACGCRWEEEVDD